MNTEFMMRDGKRLIREWEKIPKSLDTFGGKSEWMRGVIHGLRLILRLMDIHAHLPRRGQS